MKKQIKPIIILLLAVALAGAATSPALPSVPIGKPPSAPLIVTSPKPLVGDMVIFAPAIIEVTGLLPFSAPVIRPKESTVISESV